MSVEELKKRGEKIVHCPEREPAVAICVLGYDKPNSINRWIRRYGISVRYWKRQESPNAQAQD